MSSKKKESICAIKIRIALYFEPDFNKAMKKAENLLKRYESWRWRLLKYPITIVEILEIKKSHQYLWNPEIRAQINDTMQELKTKWGESNE